MYQAIYIGFIVSFLCMVPCISISFYISRKRKRFLESKGIYDFNRLPEEEKSILKKEVEELEKDQRIHVFFSLSLIFVFPALIGNAIIKGDLLKPWFIFLCCFLTYSGIALFVISG